MIAVLLLIVGLILCATHFYLWHRLVRVTTVSRRARWVGVGIIASLGLLLLISLFVTRSQPNDWLGEAFSWVGLLWFGLWFYLLLTLIALESLRFGLRWWFSRRNKPTMKTALTDDTAEPASQSAQDPSRRLVLSRGLAIGAGLITVGTVGYGVKAAFSKPRIEHVHIALPRLDPALDGFRIGVVSDIHLGPFVQKPRIADMVATLNKLDVGLVAVVGDLVDGSVAELGKHAEPLAELTAQHGSYFVTGNHEYYSGVDEWVEFLPTIGVTVLQNERITIKDSGAAFDLAGINDVTGRDYHAGPNLKGTLAGRDTSQPVVLMAHQPIMFNEAADHGVDLQLSGHTHGGQMWPFHYLVKAQQHTVAGYSRKGASQLYVTRGVGFWGPPIRVGAPPEITVIELRVDPERA